MQTEHQRPPVTAIVLNVEQTKKFLSFFIPEAFEIVKKRETIKKALEQSGS